GLWPLELTPPLEENAVCQLVDRSPPVVPETIHRDLVACDVPRARHSIPPPRSIDSGDPSMSLKASLLIAAISALVSGSALADDFPSMEISGITALSAGSTYWTSDRKKAAKERVLFRDSEISAQVA